MIGHRASVVAVVAVVALMLGCGVPHVAVPPSPAASVSPSAAAAQMRSDPPADEPSPARASGSAASAEADSGVVGLIADLRTAGADARADAIIVHPEGILLSGGMRLCVGSEQVIAYEYASERRRADVTARIDRADPTHVGDAIIDWIGRPIFWERGRIIILYVGDVPATEALLTSVLGEPLARGPGRGAPRGTIPCPPPAVTDLSRSPLRLPR